MPGGNSKRAQLFTSKTKTGKDGTWIGEIHSGSVAVVVPGAAMDAVETNTCSIVEVTISNLSSCAMMLGNVTGLSACVKYNGIIAGDGQASVVLMTTNASTATGGGSMDGRTSLLRYIAFVPA